MNAIDLIRKLLPIHFVRKGPSTFAEDGLLTRHNFDFVDDPEFMRAYKAGWETGSWGGANIRWRAHVALWAARHASGLDGDFVECGVNRGGLSRAIVEALDWTALNRDFYLLDTYCAFDPRFPPADVGYWEYGDTYDAVKASFAGFPRIHLVKGPVPDTLEEVRTDRIAYLHIDMNTTVPETEALDYFWPKLVKGGILLLDDHGFRGHEQQRAAHKAFAKASGFSILSLPTGQGLAIK